MSHAYLAVAADATSPEQESAESAEAYADAWFRGGFYCIVLVRRGRDHARAIAAAQATARAGDVALARAAWDAGVALGGARPRAEA